MIINEVPHYGKTTLRLTSLPAGARMCTRHPDVLQRPQKLCYGGRLLTLTANVAIGKVWARLPTGAERASLWRTLFHPDRAC
jgi:hypothetical protein